MFVESVLVVSSSSSIKQIKWYKVEFEIGVSEDIPTNKAVDLIVNMVHTSFPNNNNYTGPSKGRMIRVSTDHYTKQSYNIEETIKAALGQGIPKHSFGGSGSDRTIDDDDKEELGIMAP